MHHYVSVVLAICVLQVNMHTLITKKKTRNCESCITLRLMRRALDSKCRAFTPKLAGIQNKKKRRPLGRAINRSPIPATSLKWESVATRKISSSLAIFLLCGRVELALSSITQQKKRRPFGRLKFCSISGGHWIRTSGYLTISAV